MKGTALITGASSGIGESLARVFASHDFQLIVTARDTSKLVALKNSLDDPDQTHIVTADLSTREGIDHLIANTKKERVDILVNNAGIMQWGNLQDREADTIDQLIDLNIRALTHLTHHFLKGMIKRSSGKILNVASIAGFQPVPAMGLYAASKAYVLSLTESLSEQITNSGVSVTALCPGITSTPSTEQLISEIPHFIVSSADEVALAGFEALMAGETLCIPGVANKTAVAWAKLQPRSVVRKIGGFVAKFVPGQ